MVWRASDPQGQEADKVKYDVVEFTRGYVLDIGCGPWKGFPHWIGIDNYDEWGDLTWEPDVRADARDLRMFATEGVDGVFSSHLLEHLEDTRAVLTEWWRVIKPGGYLTLYLPHRDFYPRIGQEGSNPDHKHDFHPKHIVEHMRKIGGWDLLVNENRNEGMEYSFLQVYRKRQDNSIRKIALEKRQHKTACVVRYGGFGDMIQTSSIFPWLKQQGYHVTVNTTPRGHSVIEHDPHVDRFIIQDEQQVPNANLCQHWAAMEKRFDRFINLTESIEGGLLALPGRPQRWWSHKARQVLLNRNYLEVTHLIADVPEPYRPRFYPIDAEIKQAHWERTELQVGPVIVWSVSGSSVHKSWPWMDQIIARILTTWENARVILVGGELDKMLEAGWEDEERVLKRCGVWNIRQSLTFAINEADLVIGCETGLLNACGMEDVHKIIALSHSSQENLTKHWKNTIVLECDQGRVPCSVCHMLHYSFDDCFRDEETGVAKCQADISPEQMWNAINLTAKETWR